MQTKDCGPNRAAGRRDVRKLHPEAAGIVSRPSSHPCNKTPNRNNSGAEDGFGSRLMGTQSLVVGKARLCSSLVAGIKTDACYSSKDREAKDSGW